MQTANQTEMPEPMTVAGYIRWQAARAKADYDGAKEAFTTEFATNAISAIEWKAKTVVAAQMKFIIWEEIRKAAHLTADQELTPVAAREVVAFAEERCRREIEGFFGSNSTSPWHSAARRAEAEVADLLLQYQIACMKRMADRPADNT